jgi:galactokinase
MDEKLKSFEDIFGKHHLTRRFFCPGRVNLIGEHIDYLGGDVLPAAISLGIYGTFGLTDNSLVRIHSTDFNETVSFNVNELPSSRQNHWSDYVLGVLDDAKAKGFAITGFDLLLESTLPKGSGLSSSAALEVLIYYSLFKLFESREPNRSELALDCQQIENNFVGVNCGIMDQFAVANGKENHAVKLNCETLEHSHIPVKLGAYSLVIINSNKPRQLAESAYNQRRAECDEALKVLQDHKVSIKNLVDTNLNDILLIENETIRRRAKHAITENQRVQKSAKALSNNEIEEFGQLMNASHQSLKSDFEVSCRELDFIVDHLQQQKACLGARMTGAGFGGCCIAIIQTKEVDVVSEQLISEYSKTFGFAPSVFSCDPSDGVRMLVDD